MTIRKIISPISGGGNVNNAMHAVIQVVALKQGAFGNATPVWTGSGTIVHPSGIILTNCHVANPRAMGMSAPKADILAIALTERSDAAPALTYMAEVVSQSPELDFAVLRIVGTINGKRLPALNLPFIPIGDSDQLELGDRISILGYPGIGGETITFTAGTVAGFTAEQGIHDQRAWIKTDATIAGGNSGGTALNGRGELIGVPTQAAAGAGIRPVDARPVVDTNMDGRVDERDTPMAIGGFINGLRPVNLARPLLKQAGLDVSKLPTAATMGGNSDSGIKKQPVAVPPKKGTSSSVTPNQPVVPAPVKPSGKPGNVAAPAPVPANSSPFRNLVFSAQVTSDGRPIQPAALLPSGLKTLYASFDFDGVRKGTQWSQVWALNGDTVLDQPAQWNESVTRGRKTILLGNDPSLPDGEYHLVLTVQGAVVAEGRVKLGRTAGGADNDTQISGSVVAQATGKGIAGALVLALKPNVRVQQFAQSQDRNLVFASAQTDAKGQFTLSPQLPKGSAYSLVVIADGYRDLGIDSGLRVTENAPEQATLNPIALPKD